MATLDHPEDADRGTTRLVSETTWSDFGVSSGAGEQERVQAAIEYAVRMVDAGEAPWQAAAWCAEALDVWLSHGQLVHREVLKEVDE